MLYAKMLSDKAPERYVSTYTPTQKGQTTLCTPLQGLWKAGKPDGPGRYKWRNKNDYDGEWRAGRMHGQGTLRWASGERYDGEWVEGEEDGLGVFTWQDGTTYDGFWQSGKKHGIGVSHNSHLCSIMALRFALQVPKCC